MVGSRTLVAGEAQPQGPRMIPTTTAETATTRSASTIPGLLNAWAEERISTEGTKPANARKQAKRLRTFFDGHGWNDVRELDRAGLVAAFSDMTGSSTKTRSTLMSMVAAFLAWACRAGHINENPMRTIPRPKRMRQRGPSARRGVRPLTNTEVQRIVSATLADEARPVDSKPTWRFRSLRIVLAWTTGGR